MGQLTNRTVQLVDPVLTNIARLYRPHGLIAEQVMPRVPVATETGQIVVWSSEDFFRVDTNPLVPDRAETKEVDAGLDKIGYVCEEYALKASISEREARQAASMLNLRRGKQNLVLDQLALHRELRVATLLQKSTTAGGKLTSGAAPSNNWNHADATIIADLITAKETVYDLIGMEPTHAVIPYKVANAVAQQADILEILKYTVNGQQLIAGTGSDGSQRILPRQLAGLELIIPRGRKVTSAEGAASTTYADVWGDDVRVLYLNPNPDTESPSVGYTLEAAGRETKTWRNQDPSVEYIRSRDGVLEEKVVAADAGYVIQDVLS